MQDRFKVRRLSWMLFETRSYLATACNRRRKGRGAFFVQEHSGSGRGMRRRHYIWDHLKSQSSVSGLLFLNANAERSFLSLKAVATEQASCAMSLSHHVGCDRPLPPEYGCHSISRTQLAISGAASTRF